MEELDLLIDFDLDAIFREMNQHKIAGRHLSEAGLTSLVMSCHSCASKFTYFAPFNVNTRALKPSIGTSLERTTRRERERESENMALAPDP